MTNTERHEELLQTLAAVNLEARQGNPLSEEIITHIANVLKACKIKTDDEIEVINGIRHFKFDYHVPEADAIVSGSMTIQCKCSGFIRKEDGGIVVVIKSSEFDGLDWSDLCNATATYIKLHEAAKQYYINQFANAKPSLMSEQEVNDILNINNNN